jgi:signal transduction histidine kinase
MRRIQLHQRIALAITLLQVGLIGTVLSITLSMSRRFEEERLATKSWVLRSIVGSVARVALIQGEYDNLQPYVERLTEDPEVRRVRVADDRGRIVVSSDRGEVGRPMPGPGDEPDRLEQELSIANPSGRLGTLSIRLDDAAVLRNHQETRNVAVLVSILGVIASAVAGLVIGRLLTRRLQALAEAIQQVTSGRLEVALPTAGSDEVGRLSDLFNQMAQSLRTQVATLRENEERLRQAQKMEVVGLLAGGVAHDFNNLLTVIEGCTSSLADRVQDPDLRDDVMEIQGASRRAATLTRQLLALGRKGVVQPRVLELGQLVEETEKLLRRTIGEQVRLSIGVEPGLWRVKADPGRLEQLLLNLAINARDAMPEGGTIEVSLGNVALAKAPRGMVQSLSPGDYVVLEVADTGIGMTREIVTRIFEPFFTTKGEGRGTGLGLATVFEIVREAGGGIAVESEPGKGSRFRVYLPRVLEITTPLTPTLAGSESEDARGRTVLVVEDEAAVRAQVVRMLRRGGYRVLEAADRIEALALFGEDGGDVELVITDVVMPNGSAAVVARELRQRKPTQRILYVSGYPDGVLGTGRVFERDAAFLQKPFSEAELLDKVREVLARPAPGPGAPAGS